MDTAQLTVTVAAPPEAGFSASATGGCAPASVAFTDLSLANVTAWNWSFRGAPATSTEQNPLVVYDSAGTFDVTLAVSLDGTDSLTQSGAITLAGPPETSFTTTITGMTVSFLNTTMNATSYAWGFGDGGASAEINPVITFSADGIYTVTLAATNACGTEIDTQTITVATPPTAAFVPSVPFGCAPASMQYQNQSSANVTGFFWSFPGGMPATSTESDPIVMYPEAGVYGATLIVTGFGGLQTLTRTGVINIFTGLPEADFNAASADGLIIYFENLSQNATSYFWEFGDGATSTEINPAHTYAAQGTYTVTLTLQNPCGQGQITKDVPVEVGTKTPQLEEKTGPDFAESRLKLFRIEVDLNAVSARVLIRLLEASGRLCRCSDRKRYDTERSCYRSAICRPAHIRYGSRRRKA